MAINFPDSPSTNDTYTVDAITWVYDGAKWTLSGAAFQPLDAELTAIAGLTSAADRVPHFTGSGTAALATFTAAGRALVDDADAAAQRTTLGLGTMATQASSSVSITGGSVTGITDLAVADGGTGASTAADARTNLSVPLSAEITTIKQMTAAAYAALGSKDSATLYVIVG